MTFSRLIDVFLLPMIVVTAGIGTYCTYAEEEARRRFAKTLTLNLTLSHSIYIYVAHATLLRLRAKALYKHGWMTPALRSRLSSPIHYCNCSVMASAHAEALPYGRLSTSAIHHQRFFWQSDLCLQKTYGGNLLLS